MRQMVEQELNKQAAWSEVFLTNPIESVSQVNQHFYYNMVVKEKCKLEEVPFENINYIIQCKAQL
jgi:hypothetical protein